MSRSTITLLIKFKSLLHSSSYLSYPFVLKGWEPIALIRRSIPALPLDLCNVPLQGSKNVWLAHCLFVCPQATIIIMKSVLVWKAYCNLQMRMCHALFWRDVVTNRTLTVWVFDKIKSSLHYLSVPTMYNIS